MASAFFYGTLLHPQVLKRVLDHDGEHFQVAPAILLDYTRHHVRDCDYPAIIPSSSSHEWFKHQLTAEQCSVRGTLVTGLSSEDMVRIDLFEGEEYHRKLVEVRPLTALTPFIDSSETITTLMSPEAAFSHEILLPAVSAHTYIWADDTSLLLPELWSFDKFVEEKLWRWIGKGSVNNTDYLLVDERKALNGKTSSSRSSNSPLAVLEPPLFGRHLRSQFFFEKDYVNLNHGSYGSLPRPVAEDCHKLEQEVEAKPDLFIRREYTKSLEIVRGRLARLVHANLDEIVMVPNATHGINTILRNLQWSHDDIIIQYLPSLVSTTYGAVTLTADYIHDCTPYPQINTILLTFPTTHADIIANFKAHIKSISRSSNSKVVAIIDSISSNPGCLLPWKELVHICHQEGIISVIDGAHSIGQELHINLDEVKPDFWHLIRSSLPTSWNYIPIDYQGPPPATPNNFVAQFDRNGTTDVVPFLSVLYALKFRDTLGGEEHINKYCHELAMKGGMRLAQLLGTETFPEELTLNMTNVRLPLIIPDDFPIETLGTMRAEMEDKLMHEWDCFVAVFVHDKRWWTRCSAQVFNDILTTWLRPLKQFAAICPRIKRKLRHSINSKLEVPSSIKVLEIHGGTRTISIGCHFSEIIYTTQYENPSRPLVLHTLPTKGKGKGKEIDLKDKEAERVGSQQEQLHENESERPTKQRKFPASVATIPRLITIAEITKRQYVDWARKRVNPDKSIVPDELRIGLHQYNELETLEELELENNSIEDNNLIRALSGKNYPKKELTPHLRITLSVSALPESKLQGATYQAPDPFIKSKSARARERRKEKKRKEAAA
ncbi:hypothetical protein Clacol_002883 [Clathrus columnatus]|uniref:Uncharacterized protein n=1 Tax=Clathrus columnatus TaxID=1419009 RepID=A0AAV5A7E3_9AGAM|nr:hypothetical protein Clacol_002883 [Clathrus columnatus]